MLDYKLFKEVSLSGRLVDNSDIVPLEEKHSAIALVNKIGVSVKGNAIYTYEFGVGENRILIWSQMHGNESTTTKAIFDFLNRVHIKDENISLLISKCTFCIIPILNPDGAEEYTRLNANGVDLNRDSQSLTQPESKLLKNLYDKFKPDFCFNLHGQRTIFSAGFSSNSSVLSFLSPAQNEQRSIGKTRKIAMGIICTIKEDLKSLLEGKISRYDDSFNINCVGDSFQSLETPTVLFEAGHFPGDYNREKTRYFVYRALLTSFLHIANKGSLASEYQGYFELPKNQKLFFDVIIRNVIFENEVLDVAIQYEEVLIDRKVLFIPKIFRLGILDEYFGHKEFEGDQNSILINNSNKKPDLLTIIDKISINDIDFAEKISV
jgi:hypothetical protein